MVSPARAPRLAAVSLPGWIGRLAWIPESAARTGSAGTSGPTPVLKQLPMLVLFLLAMLASSVVPTLAVTAPRSLLIACAILVVGTLLAVLTTARPALARFAVLVPALDFLAVGMLRIATGENASIFGSLVILPVIWFSLNPGRGNVLVAFVGVYVSLGLPLLLRLGQQNANELWRGFFSALAFAVAALVVNELSRRTRLSLEESRDRERLSEEELTRASVVQQALLPKTTVPLSGYQVAGACLPSKAVGGDFFDWYPVSEGLAFTLGDVMGKGVGAGIIAATARAVVRSAKNVPDPVAAIERTADCFTAEMSAAASFATVFHARVRAEDHTVLYADAGHGLSVLVRADGTHERLESTDLPVGVPGAAGWRTHEVPLGPGDLIVTFSDGVLDLYDGTLRAVDRVAELAHASASADDLVRRITALAAAQANPDDVTVVVLRREA
ncbi:serine phosphatase RsbU (regulator of sigma subunit) [Clavibacter michiganensis]|uniref:PP2C family protein-serine/threonine phosphatase n=1 Tax=Clavibacter michiganensis TaxID=28447 RepID=UPI001AE3A1E1|nr:SpoIIE family protein phosphatase [Clavibacter michiganensis]MBP2456483.1 serine phosphatase RsbU (regulator of sigma subunit) [Clavibacter michiganensis]MDQ0409053.1 serine phosphatase RsbU (regulator of sigma subunit) [Clavibacter michiganensis]